MAEDVQKALEAMSRETDGNPEARAFLAGMDAGLRYNPAAQAEAKEQPAAS